MNATQHNWTSEDFERWLALQNAIGLNVVNPEAVAKIRAELKQGATMSPMQKVTPQKCKLVEKKNRLAVHGLFDSIERAQKHLAETIPDHLAKGYFMDKTLTKDSFEIIP